MSLRYCTFLFALFFANTCFSQEFIRTSHIFSNPGGKVQWKDLDNDLDVDLIYFVFNEVCETKIYENQNGDFVEVMHSIPGIFAGDLALVDYDGDADIDIMISGATLDSDG